MATEKTVEEDLVDEKQAKEILRRGDSVPKKYTVLDYAWPLIEENFPKNERRLLRYISDYHNRHLDSLETLYITSYPIWTPKDIAILFECTGIDKEKMEEIVENIETPDFYKIHKYYITAVPILIILLTRYFLLKKDQKKADLLYYYYGYSLYWMAHTTSFKKFKPKEAVVVYTMNNITNKFKLKQCGSVNKWIYYMINQIMTTYREWVLRAADYELMQLVDATRTKIGNSMNTLATQIIKNAREKNIVMKSKMIDEEGEMLPTASLAEETVALAEQYTTTFFTTPTSEKILALSAKYAGVRREEIRSTITAIKDDPKAFDDVKAFYEAVFQIFLSNENYSRKDVKSTAFVAVVNNAYKKGNTVNQSMLTIREMLTKWLMKGSPLYRAVTRSATQSDLRKAIYFYMTYSVAAEN